MIRAPRGCVPAVVAALFVCAVATASAQSPYKTPSLVRTGVEMRLSIDYEKRTVQGTATLTLVNEGRQPAAEATFLLNRLMSVQSVRDDHGKALKAKSDVIAFEDDPFRQVVFTEVTFTRPVAPAGETRVSIEFGGPLVGYTETGSLYIKDRVDPAFTIIREDAYAFPTIGVPSRRLNRGMRRPDFQFRASVDVPDSQVVATGGDFLDKRVANKRATFEFAGDRVPFVNIAIAPYRVIDGEGVRVYALPEDVQNANMLLDATRQALARLETWLGPLKKAPHVTVIEIPEGFGSQASLTGGIILDASAFRDRKQLTQLYHELSHFWNPADLDRPEPRWNEGLAMYLQYRLAHDLDGFATTPQILERVRTRICTPDTQQQLRKTAFIDYGRAEMTDYSYSVGLLMFSALEELIGQDKLDAGLREYIQAHLDKGGTTEQFIQAVEHAASPVDLKPFFEKWMRSTGWTDTVCRAS